MFRELNVKNKLHFFTNGVEALNFLASLRERPFLILSDINMPKMNGLDLKKKIDEDDQLRKKSIPFIFLTTSTNPAEVIDAYQRVHLQGYFRKAANMEQMKADIKLIVDYWQRNLHAVG